MRYGLMFLGGTFRVVPAGDGGNCNLMIPHVMHQMLRIVKEFLVEFMAFMLLGELHPGVTGAI